MKNYLSHQKIITSSMNKIKLDKFTLYLYQKDISSHPPVGPTIGQRGINLMEYLKKIKDVSSTYHEDVFFKIVTHVYPNKKYSVILIKPVVSPILRKITLLSIDKKVFVVCKALKNVSKQNLRIFYNNLLKK